MLQSFFILTFYVSKPIACKCKKGGAAIVQQTSQWRITSRSAIALQENIQTSKTQKNDKMADDKITSSALSSVKKEHPTNKNVSIIIFDPNGGKQDD